VKTVTDRQPDLTPPWEKYPTYERYTIGWRMGSGEDYLHQWRKAVKAMPEDYETRLQFLQSYRPAPLTWTNLVFAVLYPQADKHADADKEFSDEEIQNYVELGLIAYDAPYQTWIAEQQHIAWPWQNIETPEDAARYNTREFWFFCRQLNAVREQGIPVFEEIPEKWKSIESQLKTGEVGEVDTRQGLLTLAQMLCAGTVEPPWKYGLTPQDSEDSYEDDMGYADAFRLWIMSAFDDDRLLWELCNKSGIPADWLQRLEEEASMFKV
jgi:hypothetical protein